MTVKDAATNSLLMFVAATCVVLVARAVVPVQAPQPSDTLTTTGATSAETVGGRPAMQDGVTVYYLHSNFRCDTCRTIEAYAKEAVETGFADELKSSEIRWEVVNYESPGNEHFAADYETVAPNVVLVKFAGGKQVAWKGLPEVWQYTGDKAAFLDFVQTSLRGFLAGNEPPSEAASTESLTAEPSQDLPLPVPE